MAIHRFELITIGSISYGINVIGAILSRFSKKKQKQSKTIQNERKKRWSEGSQGMATLSNATKWRNDDNVLREVSSFA